MIRRGPPYWFPTKRYGWGWGLPSCWQGWVVLIGYFVLTLTAALIFPPHDRLTAFLVSVHTLTLLLIVICWIKGEPPRWRWGA